MFDELKAGFSHPKLEEEIIKFCKGKIGGYKVPKRVIFMDEIPRTPVVGKVHYRKVRDLVKKELGIVG